MAAAPRRASGFTLIELLVVLVILTLLAGLVGPRVLDQLGGARSRTARVQIGELEQSLDLFKLDVGRYPNDAEGLRAIALGSLPSGIVGTLATRYQWVETIVEAALERSRDKFIQALILDGAVSGVEQAVALADDLLQAQAAYLPGWRSER